jgi:RNA polymerase sigma-70 factor, ECF subfamily
VIADVYYQLWRTARCFDANRGTALQWLMVIARTRALDHRRCRAAYRLAPHWPEADASPAAEQELIAEQSLQLEVLARVRAALGKVSAVQLRLVGLANYQGVSHT